MSSFLLGNVFLALGMISGASSQVLFKAILNETGPLGWDIGPFIESPNLLLRLAAAGLLLAAAFLGWILALSRIDLSYAYPIACASALLVTLFSVVFLGETVSPRMWIGTGLIVLGTVFLVPVR